MASTRAIVSSRTKEFYVPENEQLRALIPEAHDVIVKGEHLMACPHTTDVTRLARNLGLIVPAPITTQYGWPTNPVPFKTQRITAALLTMNSRAYVLSEMGTGKTRAALFAFDHMRRNNEVRNMLVVAPLSTLSQVWDREIFQYFPHLSVGILHGTPAKRRKVLAEQHDVYVINHDGPQVFLSDLQAKKFNVVLVDEIGEFRNPSAERWSNLASLVLPAPYAWGMTGSPTPKAPIDAWGIAKMLTPHRAPKWKKQFQRKTMRQITQFVWVANEDANDHVYAMLQPAVRYKRDDCIELPEVSYQTTEIESSAQVKRVYKQMIDKLRIAFKEGEITAANEGVLYMKLLQVACGWVYTQDRGIVSLDNRKRVEAVVDLYNQSQGKVIVFANFRHAAIELHQRMLKKKIPASLITGKTTKKQRDEIFGTFQNSKDKSMLVAHPQVMAHGLTLTEANTIVWFTPANSLEIYEQANARITRPGQIRKSLIVHLTGTKIESKVYSRLRQRAKTQGALLSLFNDEQ